MAKYFLAFLFYFFSSLFTYSQDTTLQRLLAGRQDTATVNELVNYGIRLLNTDNNTAGKVFNIALEKSQRLRYNFGIGTCYSRLGYIEGQLGRAKEAIAYNLKALPYFKIAGNVRGVAVSYNNIGCNYDILGVPDSAIHFYLEGIKELEDHKTEPELLTLLYSNVGNLYCTRQDLSKAIFYSKKGVALANTIKDTARLIIAYSALSNAYLNADDSQNALYMAKQAGQYLNRNSDPVLQTRVYLHIGTAYVALKKPDSAIAACRKAMYYSETTDVNNYIIAIISLADAYAQKKEYKQQRIVLELVLRKSGADPKLVHLEDIYDRLAKLNYAEGNYKAAYECSAKHSLYKDLAFSRQSQKAMQEIEARYQTAQKEKMLSEKQLLLSQQKLALEKSNRYIFFAIGGLLLVSLLAVGIFLEARHKKRRLASKLFTLQQQKEIDLLHAAMKAEEKERSRIAKDLHDGVAAMLAAAKMHLGSLSIRHQDLTEAKEFQQAVKLLDDSSHEVRLTSHNLMPEILMQHGLEEALRRFCNNISNEQVLKIQYATFGEIGRFSMGFELTVYRIVQEFLNNIVRHAKATTASVQLSVQNNFLSVIIEDNGIGFDKADHQSTGTGLHNLKRRIEAMNGTLEVDAHPDQGVTAFIGIDITNYKLETWKEFELA